MLTPFIIIITFVLANQLSKHLGIPKLVFYIILGMLLGPSMLNLWDPFLLNHSDTIRQVALVIILFRTGINLKSSDLKEIGLPAILMSFIPAIFEILAITFLAPLLFDISYMDAALLGSILAAVSPAVVVPNMITVINDGLGQTRKVPQLILASASIDDVFAIVVFESLLSIRLGSSVPLNTIVQLPIKLILGIFIGFLLGSIIKRTLMKMTLPQTIKSLLMLGIAMLLIEFETRFNYSGLLAIMVMGFMSMHKLNLHVREKVNHQFNKLWQVIELLLFVVVGSGLSLSSFNILGLRGILLILLALISRSIGVFASLKFSSLNAKERSFAALSYLPKATVQAALGSIPLTLGLSNGDFIFSMSVMAILLTAPLGAFLIQKTKYRLLT